jgi:hypothetical protein
MKFIWFLLASFFLQTNLLAQNRLQKDSIITDDYSNSRERSKIKIEPFITTEAKTKNSIIIIDNKIYKQDADELRKIKMKDLQLLNMISDTSSKSGIKYIYIYKRKSAL